MLLVKLEIWPGGDRERAREIGHIEIGNVSDLSPISNYEVILKEPGRCDRRGVVRDHHRVAGAWKLVARAIKELIP